MTEHGLQVDGEEFAVVQRSGQPAAHDVTWVPGPHDPPYGFSRGGSSPVATSQTEMRDAIAYFLAEINLETEYLD